MKLLTALELLNRPLPESFQTKEISLQCGFTPLHLKTFLAAQLRIACADINVQIKTGLYGDLVGNLDRLMKEGISELCVVIEWPDLDPRLGIRSLGSWRSTDITDIVDSAHAKAERLTHLVRSIGERLPVVMSPPTLPLPPMFTTSGLQSQRDECLLRQIAASMTVEIASSKHVKVLSIQRLDELSPLGKRFDPRAEITSGFPYSLEHASTLAELMAGLIHETSPKKGLITDLDDTMWAGILGEVGVEGISWDAAGGSHVHGLYQRFIDLLASAGVLVAIASKNDPALAKQALSRADMLIDQNSVFPLEINWGPKPISVGRILERWHIGQDAVVFVDDSPMEVAEVQAAFPKMDCVVFPKDDYYAAWELLGRMRDKFGKATLSAEDRLRLSSLRSETLYEDDRHRPGYSEDTILSQADGVIALDMSGNPDDNRAFELINKSNQFNLNGKRISHAEWVKYFEDPTAFLLTATYRDKYGPLGKIAVMVGKDDGPRVSVDSWVMSCRAFSRRIEHRCLQYLFDVTGKDEVVFDYRPTPRNGPMQTFFSEVLGASPVGGQVIHKKLFMSNIPSLYHRIVSAGEL